jgi:hypothetical protein
LTRDSSLDLPPPPVLPALAQEKPAAPVNMVNSFQVQVTGRNVSFYNFAMAHLHTLAGIESATPEQINPGGTSYILVKYKGDLSQLAAALSGRGWVVDLASGSVVKIHSDSDKPPAMPPPPAQPPAATPPQQPPKTGGALPVQAAQPTKAEQ